MERRKTSTTAARPTDLPKDYLKLVTDIFTTNFGAGLKMLEKIVKTKTRLYDDFQKPANEQFAEKSI